MRAAALCALVLVAVALAGCAASGESLERPAVVTVVPESAVWTLPEPWHRYPEGSQLLRLDLAHPQQDGRVLSDGLAAAGGVRVSVDGERLAFVGRQADEPFGIWISPADGESARRLEAAPDGAGGVAWLPEGRLVVAAPTDAPPPLAGMSSAWALFVVDPETGESQRITFGGTELDPSVLADGRIVYSQWLPGGDGRADGGGFALFTVHPDGTGAAPLHGFHQPARLKLAPRQLASGDLVFSSGEPAEPRTLRRTDWSRPLQEAVAVELDGLVPLAVEAAGDRLLVAAQEPQGRSQLLLTATDGADAMPLRRAAEGSVFLQVVEVAARRRPQGHLSMIDPARSEGRLLCLDARPEGVEGVRRVRLSTAGESGERVLGEVALAADGSFFATVPADQPLWLEYLDQEGRVLVAPTSPIWLRPNENRACIGCHENPLTAPPNRRPLAVLNEPVNLVHAAGG